MPLFAQHLRYAVRSLARRPAFSLVAVATLALGIGANTAIFSVVNAVLLRPLPYPDASQLVRLRGGTTAGVPGNLSPMDFFDVRERARAFAAVAAYNNYAAATLTGVGEPERLAGTRVSSDFLSVLRVMPRLGRDFTPADDRPGATPVVILTDGFWRRRFGADASIVGRTIALNGVTTEVVGVLPSTFAHPFPDDARQPDIVVPFRLDRAENNRGGHYLQAIARLQPHLTTTAAQGEVTRIAADLEREYPATDKGRTMRLEPMLDSMVGSTRAALVVLAGAVAFVLLIACANLANLLLARSASRQKEIELRRAIGASRAQLVGQLLTESLVLAVAGGGAGLTLAWWASRALLAIGAERIPRGDTIHLDPIVLGFTAALAIVTGLLFGVGPSLVATRGGGTALKDGGRTADGRLHRRAQQALIVSEVALTLMLLAGAGLLVKSLWHLQHVDPGFRVDHVLTLQTSLPLSRYPEGDQMPFYQRLEERLRSLPGVTTVGATNILPLSANYSCDGFDIEGRVTPPAEQPCAEARSVTPDYFASMGVPLVRGRGFTRQDVEHARPVVIINEKMAATFWPAGDAIGQRIIRSRVATEIVGIVGGVHHFGLDRDVTLEMYTPHTQQPSYHTMTLVIRTGTDPSALMPLVRGELAALDRDVPIANVRTIEQVVDASTTEPRFRTMLVALFAAVAIVLAVVGVAGVVGFTVSRRTQEIGVRVALGATRRQIVSLLVRQGMTPIAIGIAMGLAGGCAIAKLLSGLLFGVTPTDPAVFAGAACLLSIAALGAAYVPARRAAAANPLEALRAD